VDGQSAISPSLGGSGPLVCLPTREASPQGYATRWYPLITPRIIKLKTNGLQKSGLDNSCCAFFALYPFFAATIDPGMFHSGRRRRFCAACVSGRLAARGRRSMLSTADAWQWCGISARTRTRGGKYTDIAWLQDLVFGECFSLTFFLVLHLSPLSLAILTETCQSLSPPSLL